MIKKKDDKINLRQKRATLVDALDKVVDKGAYVGGDLRLRVADIDLLIIGLRLYIASSSRIEGQGRRDGMVGPKKQSIDDWKKEFSLSKEDKQYLEILNGQLAGVEQNIEKISRGRREDLANAEQTERDLAKLVLTLVELIRQLLEREALRRIDKGLVDRVELEKLGLTFKLLERKIAELKAVFGIKGKLNIDLGPLGTLL